MFPTPLGQSAYPFMSSHIGGLSAAHLALHPNPMKAIPKPPVVMADASGVRNAAQEAAVENQTAKVAHFLARPDPARLSADALNRSVAGAYWDYVQARNGKQADMGAPAMAAMLPGQPPVDPAQAASPPPALADPGGPSQPQSPAPVDPRAVQIMTDLFNAEATPDGEADLPYQTIVTAGDKLKTGFYNNAKRAWQDNRGSRLSATGESTHVGARHRMDDYDRGHEAWVNSAQYLHHAAPAEKTANMDWPGLLSRLKGYGGQALDYAKANPTLAGSVLGTGVGAGLGALAGGEDHRLAGATAGAVAGAGWGGAAGYGYGHYGQLIDAYRALLGKRPKTAFDLKQFIVEHPAVEAIGSSAAIGGGMGYLTSGDHKARAAARMALAAGLDSAGGIGLGYALRIRNKSANLVDEARRQGLWSGAAAQQQPAMAAKPPAQPQRASMASAPPQATKAALEVEQGGLPSRLIASSLGELGNTMAFGPLVGGRNSYINPSGARAAKHEESARLLESAEPLALSDTKLRLSGGNLVDDLLWKKQPQSGEKLPWTSRIGGRVWHNQRTSLPGKILGTAVQAKTSLISHLLRSPHYNPFTDVATNYWDTPAVSEHELGHAIDFNSISSPQGKGGIARTWYDREGRGLGRDAYMAAYMAGVGPLAAIKLIHEAAANRRSAEALTKSLKGDPDELKKHMMARNEALPAGFGSYIGGAMGGLISPLFPPAATLGPLYGAIFGRKTGRQFNKIILNKDRSVAERKKNKLPAATTRAKAAMQKVAAVVRQRRIKLAERYEDTMIGKLNAPMDWYDKEIAHPIYDSVVQGRNSPSVMLTGLEEAEVPFAGSAAGVGAGIGALADRKHRVRGAARGALTGAGAGIGKLLYDSSSLVPSVAALAAQYPATAAALRYGLPMLGSLGGFGLGQKLAR